MKISLNPNCNHKLGLSNNNKKEYTKHNSTVSCVNICAKNTPAVFLKTESIIAFKGLFDFLKTEKQKHFLPEQELTQKQAIGLINENFKNSETLKECDINPKDIIRELENLKYPINPKMLDSSAKVLELAANMRNSSLAYTEDLKGYLPLFEDKNGVFHKEVLDRLYEIGTRFDEETGAFVFDAVNYDKNVFKYLDDIKDNDGNFHPKALSELRFSKQIKHCSRFGEFNEDICTFVETLANYEKDKKLPLSVSRNALSLIGSLKDLNFNTDKEALKFAYELLADKDFSLSKNDVGYFITVSKNIKSNNCPIVTFNPEYKKYYFLLTKLCDCGFTKELPLSYNPDKGSYLVEDELKGMCNIIKAIYDSYGKDSVRGKGFEFLRDLRDHAMFDVSEEAIKLINIAKHEQANELETISAILRACRNNDFTINKSLIEKASVIMQNENITDKNKTLLFDAINLKNNDICNELFDIINKSENKYDLNEIALLFSKNKCGQNNVQAVLHVYETFKNKYHSRFSEAKSDIDKDFINTFKDILELCCDGEDFRLNKDKLKKAEYYANKISFSFVPNVIKAFGFENIEKFDLYKKVWDCAKQNKQILRQPDSTLSDKDIDELFKTNISVLSEGLDFVGEKIFLNSFKLRMNNMLQFYKILNNSLFNYRGLVQQFINPKESSEYKFWIEKQAVLKENLKNNLSDDEKTQESLLLSKIQSINNEIKDLKQTENPNVKVLLQSKQKEINFLKSKIQTIYNKPENQDIIKKINIAQQWIKSIETKAIKDPNVAIKVLQTIPGLSYVFDYSQMEQYLSLVTKNDDESKEQLNLLLNEKIFEHFGIEYNSKLSKKLDMSSSKYIINLLGATKDDFKNNFKSLLSVLSQYPDNTVSEILNNLEQNKLTKLMFEMKGINYDRWVNSDKNSFVPVTVETNKELEKQFVVKNIEADFSDELFLRIPEQEIEKICLFLHDNGFEMDHDFCSFKFYRDSKAIDFEDLGLLLKALKEFFNKEAFWNTKHINPVIEEAKNTILNHILNQRIPEYNNVKSNNSSNILNLKIRQADMNNISHSLFLGNQSSCCTAINGVNDWTAPNYIKNKCVTAIEVVDGEESLGNTMCFIADVDDETSLILDNIELVSQIQFKDNIKNGIIEYAKKLCEELGKPDMPVYAGPFRHKVHLEKYPCSIRNIKIIGSTGEDKIYADFLLSGVSTASCGYRRERLYKLR